jgi:hypothetical protein
MAYRFLGVKLLPGTHHLFLGMGRMFPGTPKLVLGTFWLLGTTPPFPRTLERFLGMPNITVGPETPCRGLLVQFTKEGTRVYRQDTAGSGKNQKRQHSQANQKYHQKAPSVSCDAHSGVKRVAFHYLGFFCACQVQRLPYSSDCHSPAPTILQ